MSAWEPEGCPIAENQTHGYRHVHTKQCGATPEQIEATRPPVSRWSQIWRRRPPGVRKNTLDEWWAYAWPRLVDARTGEIVKPARWYHVWLARQGRRSDR